MEIKIGEVIRNKRRLMNISQETLAEKTGVTIQAVSKWETGMCYPDITVLPKLADFFGLSMDGLFFGIDGDVLHGLPDDDKLRIVQCIGNRVIDKKEFVSNAKKNKFTLIIPENGEKVINLEIWGDADIEGNVSGFVDAGAGVNCGDVGTYVDAGGCVNCGAVGGYVNAGGGVNCGSVEGYADAGGAVNCINVKGNVSAGDSVHCKDVDGDVSAGDDVTCTQINGSVTCGGNVNFKAK